MKHSLAYIGLALACETCEGWIDLPEDFKDGPAICRHCGVAFLVDAPYGQRTASRKSPSRPAN